MSTPPDSRTRFGSGRVCQSRVHSRQAELGHFSIQKSSLFYVSCEVNPFDESHESMKVRDGTRHAARHADWPSGKDKQESCTDIT